MKLVILKYNGGNLRSVDFALRRIGVEPLISNRADVLKKADRVIIPGVGQAASAMKYLDQRKLISTLAGLTRPVLGICLGMHLLCRFSAEGGTRCLEITEDSVLSFPVSVKIPHMGWNTVYGLRDPLFAGIPEGTYFYFVHSFRVPVGNRTIARCDYAGPFSAGLRTGNFAGLQFHPEKSGPAGERILRNFCQE